MTLKDLRIQLQKLTKNPVSKEDLKPISDELKETVKRRTQAGFGVNQDKGPKVRLKRLSTGYVKQRRQLKKDGVLGGAATVQKSNVSKTGQMLGSMKNTASDNEIRIYIDGAENVSKVEDLSRQGRVFMNLSKTEFTKVRKQIKEAIQKKIKRIIG